jgi:chitinase
MISILHSALDLVMIMSYDFHEINRTSINAPLNRENNQNPYTETVAENVDRMLAQGCNPTKMIMGIPTYGRTYTLKDVYQNGVDAAVDGLGEPGPFTLSNGSLGFNEVKYLSKMILQFPHFT